MAAWIEQASKDKLQDVLFIDHPKVIQSETNPNGPHSVLHQLLFFLIYILLKGEWRGHKCIQYRCPQIREDISVGCADLLCGLTPYISNVNNMQDIIWVIKNRRQLASCLFTYGVLQSCQHFHCHTMSTTFPNPSPPK